jgi:predicted transcriptional regulator
MNDYTSIRISKDIKKELDELISDDETYNTAVKRALGESGMLWTEGEIRDVCREIVNEELQSIRR